MKLPTGSNFKNVQAVWLLLPEGVGLTVFHESDLMILHDLLTFRLRFSLKPKWLCFGEFVC